MKWFIRLLFVAIAGSVLVFWFGRGLWVWDKGTHHLRSHLLTHSVPDRSGVAEMGPPKLSEDFRFVFAVGGYATGYWVLRVNSSGQCTYGFPEVKGQVLYHKRLDFEVTRAELESLCEKLAESRLAELDISYSADVWDGTILFIKCNWEDASKFVHCHNHFPDEVVSIHDYVLDRIIAPHVDQNLAAKKEAAIIDEKNPRAGVEDLFIELTELTKQEE